MPTDCKNIRTTSDVLASPDALHPVWLQVGTLVDGDAEPRRDAHVVYDAERIRYVGDTDQPPPADLVATDAREPNALEPDAVLSDYTLLPGLIEAHAHLFLDGAPLDGDVRSAYLKESPDWQLERGRNRLQKLMHTGVTAVRDAGDRAGVGLALRDAYVARAAGVAASPYIDSPGSAIHHQGRYASFMAEPVENFDTPADCVAGRVAAGADRIKLIATGIINFKAGKVTAPPQMDLAELEQFVAAAKDHGKPTFAHASGTDGIENVIEAGVESVEHGYFVTDDQLRRMADRRIAWVPTLAPVQMQIDAADVMGWSDEIVDHLRRIIDCHMTSLRKAIDFGVPVVAGSDAGSCGVAHGLGFLYELELMQRAGLSPLEVIRSATGRSATTIGYGEPIGRIAADHRARMILTRHDPLADVANLYRDKLIIFDGVVLASNGDRDAEGL